MKTSPCRCPMSEHVGGRVMLVGERRKLLIFMNGSFRPIGHARRVHRRPAVEAYRDRGKLATLTSGQNKYATPVFLRYARPVSHSHGHQISFGRKRPWS